MTDRRKFEFYVLRYVPDAVSDEFANIGVLMFEPGTNDSGFADLRFRRDWRRVLCMDRDADLEMLAALERDIRAEMSSGKSRETLIRKLEDSFSNAIQLSPVKACLAENPAKEIEVLASLYFGPEKGEPRVRLSGRQGILHHMRTEFESAGILRLLTPIAAAPFTGTGDPFKFDFGYRIGNDLKLFHAVSLKASVEPAIALSLRYPKIVRGMEKGKQWQPALTAVVDDGLDTKNENVQFALKLMNDAEIRVRPVAEMPEIAQIARRELLG